MCTQNHPIAMWLRDPLRVSVAACVLIVATILAPLAHADPPDPPGDQYTAFYMPPDPIPGEPGDLIRHEPSKLVYEPSGQLGAYVADGTRIMYRSRGPLGRVP